MKLYIAFFILLFCVSYNETNAFSEVVPITSSLSSINHISKLEVRSLYLMKTRKLANGEPVHLFKMPNNSESHKLFVRDVLKLSINQYNREIDRMNEAGANIFIHTVKSKQEMLFRVSSTFNAIGYVDSDHLIIYAGEDDVKTLRIVE